MLCNKFQSHINFESKSIINLISMQLVNLNSNFKQKIMNVLFLSGTLALFLPVTEEALELDLRCHLSQVDPIELIFRGKEW